MSSQRTPSTTRRALLGGALASLLPDARAAAPMMRRIPSSGEALPVVGLGSWITFNVGNDTAAREACVAVVRAFFAADGRLIDSSPMYGSSQPTIGHALAQLGHPAALFSAEKVWVGDGARGAAQIEASRAYWERVLWAVIAVGVTSIFCKHGQGESCSALSKA